MMSAADEGITGASATLYQTDKALSQLSLNPSPSVDDLLAAAAGGKPSPKSGGDAKAGTNPGDLANATDGGASSEALPNSAAATTKLRVRIKRVHAVARWTWNVAGVSPGGNDTSATGQQRMSVDFPPDEEEEVCTICQSAFEGTAPGSKFPGDECPVVWGKCGHSFHLSCVSTWLSDKTTCPYCRAEWEFGLDEPVEEDDDEDGEEKEEADLGEGNTSAERSGNTVRRRQLPTRDDSSDDSTDDDVDDQHDSAGDSQEDAEEEEEDDFWDSESDSEEEEEEEEEEESLNNADSENDASRSPSPFRGAGGGSESYDSDGDVGGPGRSYRYATP